MSNPNGPDAHRGPNGEHEGERVVVRDRRRIDPLTGEVRTPAGEEPAGAPAPGEPAPATDPRIDELEAEVAERTSDLQRVSAEYANYRRRVDRDREGVLAAARAQFASELLTVIDDIERAEQHGDLNGPFKSVADKVVGVLAKLGLEPFGVGGEPFEPSVHEAVQHEESDAVGATVTVVSSVLRRGYRMGDRVLRPAMVTVVDRAAADVAAAAEPAPQDEQQSPEQQH
ncbi:nucleotide exchange factor GrpE [Pseudonocardia sp. N23]|uniref:nucleotide exchange factor GrpE n=1 Tax=Pseudonocardia sp. N23 TaxID=1987376 RepID=UPI000BFE5D15|nr:nucleotide exchange factor GrpE [Pseudonocardia sp. N23]GAY11044.1 heat shock protein GrpE [Pseudonocardia sp. N23]